MLQRTVAPQGLLVSLQEVKTHLRLDHSSEDRYLEGLVQSATEWVEQTLGRALLLQTWQKIDSLQHYDQLGLIAAAEKMRVIELDYPPLLEVLSVSSLESQDIKRPVRRFSIDTKHLLPRIIIGERQFPIEIIYRCGYGDRPVSVPASLRHAVLIVVAHFYENRAQEAELKIPLVQSLLNPYRIVRGK